MSWTKKKPEPPESLPSHYYWYYEFPDKEPTVIEVWPNRWLKHLDGYWWPERIKMPSIKELKK